MHLQAPDVGAFRADCCADVTAARAPVQASVPTTNVQSPSSVRPFTVTYTQYNRENELLQESVQGGRCYAVSIPRYLVSQTCLRRLGPLPTDTLTQNCAGRCQGCHHALSQCAKPCIDPSSHAVKAGERKRSRDRHSGPGQRAPKGEQDTPDGL